MKKRQLLISGSYENEVYSGREKRVKKKMGEVKHLAIVKFKEGVDVEEMIKGMEKMVSQIDAVKSFVWGQDVEGPEMLTQGFTHVFEMTFVSKASLTSFLGDPIHVEFSSAFSAAIEKIVLLDFPAVVGKAPA
ncbi:hypothetical protein MLD38_011691 [Melastoma candidum]|uniref:Uncharacterized protein n=1 Tax=Melastoma candidum TaxID=119954 RepID=A0ACB9R573_9MYRT|nr:hypothetical protein MLD38_011691 [Melastoma candidum]